jgi:hypothetical protein
MWGFTPPSQWKCCGCNRDVMSLTLIESNDDKKTRGLCGECYEVSYSHYMKLGENRIKVKTKFLVSTHD